MQERNVPLAPSANIFANGAQRPIGIFYRLYIMQNRVTTPALYVRANCLSDSRVKGCKAFATLEGLLAHLL